MDPQLQQLLELEGYIHLKEIPGRGICGLRRFAFTTGLVYGMDRHQYEGRFCYPNHLYAKLALESWTGIGDPPDKDWVKHKGHVEYSNPKLNLEIQ